MSEPLTVVVVDHCQGVECQEHARCEILEDGNTTCTCKTCDLSDLETADPVNIETLQFPHVKKNFRLLLKNSDVHCVIHHCGHLDKLDLKFTQFDYCTFNDLTRVNFRYAEMTV